MPGAGAALRPACRAQFAFNTLSRVSPVSHGVCNVVKRVVIIGTSVVFFGTTLTTKTKLGAAQSAMGKGQSDCKRVCKGLGAPLIMMTRLGAFRALRDKNCLTVEYSKHVFAPLSP